MSEIKIMSYGKGPYEVHRGDVQWCAERSSEPDPDSFQGMLRQLLLAGFCLLFLIGCSSTPKFTVETITPEQFTVTVDGFASKQDDTITAVKANTEAIEKIVVKVQSLEGAILDTRKSWEAYLVKSETDNGQEVITSEDTPADKTANDSQTATRSVAESAGVPLFVSVAPFCGPCESLKKDYLAGKLAGFDVKFCVQTESHAEKLIGDGIHSDRVIICVPSASAQDALIAKGIKPNRIMIEAIDASPFPAIRYRSGETVTGWKWHTPRGYGPRILMELRATLLGEETPVVREYPQTFVEPVQPAMSQGDLISLHNQLHGGGNWTWPGDLSEHLRNVHGVQIDGTQSRQTGSQVYRSRSVVRFVPQRSIVNWRARSVSRSSCPSGGCP